MNIVVVGFVLNGNVLFFIGGMIFFVVFDVVWSYDVCEMYIGEMLDRLNSVRSLFVLVVCVGVEVLVVCLCVMASASGEVSFASGTRSVSARGINGWGSNIKR